MPGKPKSLLHWKKPRLTTAISHNIQLTGFVNQGNLDAARNVFDEMPHRTVVSWNAIISGYAKWGRSSEALDMVARMHRSGTRLSETTFSSVLSLCARSASIDLGRQLHCLVLRSGSEDFTLVGSALLNLYTTHFEIHDARRLFDSLRQRNPLLWSSMIAGFVRCDMMGDALDFFERMPTPRDVASWTTLISGYSRTVGECGKSLELFLRMRGDGETAPNEFTYDSVLRACTVLGDLEYGKMIHGCLINSGFESDRSVCGALIELYCDCDAVEDAKMVFDLSDNPCLSTSNALIGRLTLMGRMEDAELVFSRIIHRNSGSYNLMIKGYEQVGRIDDSKNLFQKMPHSLKNIVSSNTMMSVYHRNGEFEEALKLFEQIKGERNTVTWNSMISGYIQNEQPAEALRLYATMQHLTIACSRSTFSALFRACASIGTLQQGRMLHAHLGKTPFESNHYVGTSLVDMYAKCGSMADARASFLRISSPNVASWTALINGLAHNGLGIQAILEFDRMIKHGVDPNAVTFVGLLSACGQARMVGEGMSFFHSMERNYGLVPTLEHYTCIVDLLGRSGRIIEAEELIKGMPINPDAVVWGALLNACWFFVELEVGERVADRLLCLDSNHVSTYVVLSNIYAKSGRWEEVMKVRKKLRGLNVRKDPGCSWIQVKDRVCVYSVEDRSHPLSAEIYQVLEELAANICSFSQTDHDSYDVLNPTLCIL